MYHFFQSQAPPRPRISGVRSSVPSVDIALSTYLARRIRLPDLGLAAPPILIPAGWEAYLYRFRLCTGARLPVAFDRPLILRLYAGPRGRPRACHEFAAMTHAYRAGYPVPEPVLLEPDSGHLGGPFLIMEDVPGETLLDRLRGNSLRVLEVPACLARMHARLHALPTTGLGTAPGSFLERQLSALQETIQEHDLGALTAALRWLDAHHPAENGPPRLLHLDFHPDNLIARENEQAVVIDWSEADVGDIHADVATTLLLLRYAPVEGLSLGERIQAPVARWFLARRYLKLYRRQAVIDPGRLDYYLALACLRRLATYGMWLRGGPLCNGSKPSAVRRITPRHVRALERCFLRLTGTMATLSPAGAA
jgi:aminoglycoside phosphotransferase (APT) family kinase protein